MIFVVFTQLRELKMKSDSKSSLRDFLWPIYGAEHKKFLPLSVMMALVLFNYSMLRSVKDGLVVTGIGTEAVSFLKTYFVFPSAILATFLYSLLCQFMDYKKVFYVFAGLFGLYFFAFGYEFFPNTHHYHVNQATIDSLCQWAPRFQWFFKIYQSWTFCTFYIIAELWGSMMLSLFFWQLANQITKTSEAKRFYPMYALIGNLGLIATGTLLRYVMNTDIEADVDDVVGFKAAINMLLVSLVLIIALNWYVQNVVATDPALVDQDQPAAAGTKKKKVKLGFWESMKVIFSSPYLGLVAVLVVCYGFQQLLSNKCGKSV